MLSGLTFRRSVTDGSPVDESLALKGEGRSDHRVRRPAFLPIGEGCPFIS